MPTPIFIEMYTAASLRDCSLAKTIDNLLGSFPNASIIELVPLAKSLYSTRVAFMDSVEATAIGRRAASRQISTLCPRCRDKYCANSELVQYVTVPRGK